MHLDDVEYRGIPTLQGRLREISLDSQKSFDALSYVWEDDSSSLNEEKPVPIYILLEGKPSEPRKPLETPKSCYIALKNLRDHHGVRTIWVDAICINQKNDSEKNMQIPLMKEIYGKARKVYIWLGESKTFERKGTRHTSEDELEYLRQTSSGHFTLSDARLAGYPANMSLHQIARSIRVLREAASDSKFSAISCCMHLITSMTVWFPSPAVSSNDASLKDLINRKWFRRMWTIQEMVMAEEPFVVCGKGAIRWNKFFWGVVLTWERMADDKKTGFEAIMTSLHGIESLWTDITMILEHIQSKHWDWVDKKNSYYSCWDKFLCFMEQHGETTLFYEVTLGFLLILPRLYSKGLPINSLGHFFGPFQAFLFLVGALNRLLTPPKRNNQWKGSLQARIISVLHSCRHQDATNPKDKVYALYGLLTKLEIELPSPKYEDSHSLEATYLEFAEAIIKWQGSLEILLEATGPWGDAPSWVPNWSEQYMRLSFFKANATRVRTLLEPRNSFQFSSDRRGLEIMGREVGVVVCKLEAINRSRPRFWQDVDPSKRVDLVFGAPQERIDEISALYEWFVTATEVYALGREEIAQFMDSNIHGLAIYTAEEKRKWFDLFFIHYSRSSSGAEDGSAGLHPGHIVLDMLLQNDRLFSVHRGICHFFARSMTCFILKAGQRFLLGIGPSSTQKKDRVVLLPTLRAPMVARVKESTGETRELQVVGATLVDNMMDGQFWPEDNSGLEAMLVV
jgi:hypothetical protein